MKRREVSWTLTKTWTVICGSRRDEEEGGGAGPSRQPRRDQEEGGGAGLRKLFYRLLQPFLNSCATDIVFVTLLHTAVETAIDDLRKSRGLHSVSSYRHGLYIYKSMPAGVAITVSTWAR